MIPVSVVVPVRNEEKNIQQCLAGLSDFQEVIVVDSFSDDATATIARKFGAKVIMFDWNGRFPKKRNWVLRTYAFSTNWVLFLDADEVVDKSFCDELSIAVASGIHQAFWLNYTNYFQGKKLRFGVPQRKLACFRVDAGEYEQIDEDNWSKLDMEIHEHPIISGNIGVIRSPIDHRDFRGLARFLERHIDYAKWECRRLLKLRQEDGGRNHRQTMRQSFKYDNIDKSWFAHFYFIYTYFFRLGILDGFAGYQYASYKRWYFQTVRNLIKEAESDAFQ